MSDGEVLVNLYGYCGFSTMLHYRLDKETALVLASAICLIPFFILRRIDLHFSKEIIQNIRQKKYEYNFIKKSLSSKLEEFTKNIRHLVKFKKILHGDSIEYDNYANKKVKELVELYQDSRKNTLNSIKKIKRSMSDDDVNRNEIVKENNDKEN